MPAPPVSVAAVHDIVGFVRCAAGGLNPAGVVGARLSNSTVFAPAAETLPAQSSAFTE